MDLQSLLRLKNLFDPSVSVMNPDQGAIAPNVIPQDAPSINTAINNPVNTEAANVPPDDTGYQPRHDISDSYRGALANPPVDEPISKWRRLAGIVSGGLMAGTTGDIAGGVKLGQNVLDDPNNKAKVDYNHRLDQLGKGATEEDKFNTNERIRIYNSESNDIKRAQLDINQQKADAITKAAETKELAENQKHETAMQKLKDHVAEVQSKLALAKRKLDQGDKSETAKEDYHKAQLENVQAIHDAQIADMEFKQGQMERVNEAKIKHMEALNANSANASKTKETTIYGPDGKVQQRGVTKTGPTQGMTRMLAKDGITEVDVPNDKVDDFVKNYGGTRKQ